MKGACVFSHYDVDFFEPHRVVDHRGKLSMLSKLSFAAIPLPHPMDCGAGPAMKV